MILHATVRGEGHPILFLHTGMQTGETDFIFQQAYFQKNYQVIVLDLRGHGQSYVEKIDMQSYFTDCASDVLETMNDLQLEKAHIVGCSLGALVGLVFAKKYPDRLHSLTLSGIIPRQPDNWESLRREDIERQIVVLQNDDAIHYFNAIHKTDWQEFMRQSMVEDWYPFHETADLSTLTMPTLFIVGEDKRHEVKGVTDYPCQNNLIHVAVVTFAGHLVHLEQPEIYTSIVKLFLSKVEEA